MANQKKSNKKPNQKNNNTTKKVTVNNKKEVKVKETKKVTPQNKEQKEQKKEIKKVVPLKEEKKVEKAVKEKKKFTLTSKQKDIILVLLVVALLVVAFIVSSAKTAESKLDIELPVALEGTAGFNEITYSEYEQKMADNELFVVVIVKDGCGYCEMYIPVVTKVATEYKIPVNYINLTHLTEEEYNKISTSNDYLKRNSWGTPTTLFMYGDKVVDSIGGYVDEQEFINFVKENIKVEDNGNE